MADRDNYESSCTCAVCMEDLGTKVSACPCGHVYHTDCINKWMRQQRTCPQCKACAVPLTKLQFNLFTLGPEENTLSKTEILSALKSEHMVLSLAIDNELAEINVLEPQLAEAQDAEKAYLSGIEPRQKRRDKLEDQLLTLRSSIVDFENRHKQLQEKSDELRTKLLNMFLDDFSSSSSRRPIAQSEIPKIITFMVADSRKLVELKEEKRSLETQLSALKQKLGSLNNTIRSFGPSNAPIVSATQDFRMHGFVPIDAFGVKRKREEDFDK
jgi:prefoldin subunit 5